MSDPFAPLRARFVERVRGELVQLKAGQDVRPIVHRLSGTAGTLGFDEISRLAAVVDDQLLDGPADPQDMAALLAALEALSSAPG